jgi:hypothetical protein
VSRFSLEKTFEGFWAEHVTVVEPPPQDEADVSRTPWSPVKV